MTRGYTRIYRHVSPGHKFFAVFAARRRETEGFFSRKIPTAQNLVARGYVSIYTHRAGAFHNKGVIIY
jgi:hypothetical protein